MIDHARILMSQGKQIAAERINGVNDNMTRSHYHEYFELYYLEAGERYHMVGDQLYFLKAGEFILFPPYVMHYSYGEKNTKFRRIVLYFTKEMFSLPTLLDVLGTNARVYQQDEKRILHGFLDSILKETADADRYSEISMYLSLNQLLLYLARSSASSALPEKESRITKILYYIHEHYTESITLNDLAAHFYLSPYYLCREFKKHTDSTIIQYINSLRISHAQRLFQETDLTITEISKTVGFANLTHFNRIYKSITGVSPSQSKKQAVARRNSKENSGFPLPPSY